MNIECPQCGYDGDGEAALLAEVARLTALLAEPCPEDRMLLAEVAASRCEIDRLRAELVACQRALSASRELADARYDRLAAVIAYVDDYGECVECCGDCEMLAEVRAAATGDTT